MFISIFCPNKKGNNKSIMIRSYFIKWTIFLLITRLIIQTNKIINKITNNLTFLTIFFIGIKYKTTDLVLFIIKHKSNFIIKIKIFILMIKQFKMTFISNKLLILRIKKSKIIILKIKINKNYNNHCLNCHHNSYKDIQYNILIPIYLKKFINVSYKNFNLSKQSNKLLFEHCIKILNNKSTLKKYHFHTLKYFWNILFEWAIKVFVGAESRYFCNWLTEITTHFSLPTRSYRVDFDALHKIN